MSVDNDTTQPIFKIYFTTMEQKSDNSIVEGHDYLLVTEEFASRYLEFKQGFGIRYVQNPHLYGQTEPRIATNEDDVKYFVPSHKVDGIKVLRTSVNKAQRGFHRTVQTIKV